MQTKQKKSLTVFSIIVLCTLMIWSTFVSSTYASSNPTGKGDAIIQMLSISKTETSLSQTLENYMQTNSIPTDSIAFSIYDIEGMQIYEHNADVDFTSASLYKVPLAMLYYDQLMEGTITEDTLLPYCTNCYEEGGPIGSLYSIGDFISLKELLYDVIVYSDNTAGHILFEYLGGWTSYRNAIRKYSLDTRSFTNIDENSFSAQYALDVLRYLYENETKYATLIEDMYTVYPQDYLNRYVSSNAAQKYGSYGSARNAMGIVYGSHPYLIVVLSDMGEDGIDVIGDINKIVYEYFNAE